MVSGWRGRRDVRLVALALAATLLAACSSGPVGNRSPRDALFSWNPLVVNEEGGEVFESMGELGLAALYQEFSTDESDSGQLAAFLSRAREDAIEVYALVGDPRWGLDPEGEELCRAIDEAAAIDGAVASVDGSADPPRLRGVVLDVEPYVLDEWKGDPKGVAAAYLAASRRTYELARSQGLEVVVCIPHYYEEIASPELLDGLIGECCDTVAVMNYDRGREVENLATEARVARDHGKGLVTIYELQRPNDRYQVGEGNTYWSEGLDAVRSNYADVQAAYPDQPVALGLHNYGALQELATD